MLISFHCLKKFSIKMRKSALLFIIYSSSQSTNWKMNLKFYQKILTKFTERATILQHSFPLGELGSEEYKSIIVSEFISLLAGRFVILCRWYYRISLSNIFNMMITWDLTMQCVRAPYTRINWRKHTKFWSQIFR